MVRPWLLEFPNEGTAYTKRFSIPIYGTKFTRCPIYNGNQDEAGNSIRDGIYLPDENKSGLTYLQAKISRWPCL